MRALAVTLLLFISGCAKPIASAVAQPMSFPPASEGGFSFVGRGNYHFEGAVECPMAGVGARGPRDSNRIGLDDGETTVTVDPRTRRILFTNAHEYREKQMVADLMFLAAGYERDGAKVAAAVHLEIEKKGTEFVYELHPHAPADRVLERVDVDDYEVALSNGTTRVIAMDHARATAAILHPSGLGLEGWLMRLKDNTAGRREDPREPGYRVADVTKSLGIRHLSKKLVNVQIVSMDGTNAPMIGTDDLPAMLSVGTWELRVTSLSSLFPQKKLLRDLFVLGLESGPVMDAIAAKGLPKGKPLVFHIEDGKGSLRLGSVTQDVPGIVDSARGFLEFNFFGSQVAWRATHRLADDPAEDTDRIAPRARSHQP